MAETTNTATTPDSNLYPEAWGKPGKNYVLASYTRFGYRDVIGVFPRKDVAEAALEGINAKFPLDGDEWKGYHTDVEEIDEVPNLQTLRPTREGEQQ